MQVIIPVYNEEPGTLEELAQRLDRSLSGESVDYRLLFIDDGSRESTQNALRSLAMKNSRVRVIRLSRNFGQQSAISAGIAFADADVVAFMDADLQDRPEALPVLLQKWREGADVAYAVRKNRKEGEAKKFSYHFYYRILRLMADIPIPVDSGDFCVIDRKVMDVLRRLPEKNRFHRGLRTWAGFRQVGVEIDRDERFGGEPKFGLLQLLNLGMSGLVSFSIKPLRAAIFFGFFELLGAALYALFIIFGKLRGERVIEGWTSLTLITLFTTGIIILLLGVIGEYIGQIFLEVKGRPPFVIAEVIESKDAGSHDNHA
jgi:polyisoprenyl-phosphate glycosyltransferase